MNIKKTSVMFSMLIMQSMMNKVLCDEKKISLYSFVLLILLKRLFPFARLNRKFLFVGAIDLRRFNDGAIGRLELNKWWLDIFELLKLPESTIEARNIIWFVYFGKFCNYELVAEMHWLTFIPCMRSIIWFYKMYILFILTIIIN